MGKDAAGSTPRFFPDLNDNRLAFICSLYIEGPGRIFQNKVCCQKMKLKQFGEIQMGVF